MAKYKLLVKWNDRRDGDHLRIKMYGEPNNRPILQLLNANEDTMAAAELISVNGVPIPEEAKPVVMGLRRNSVVFDNASDILRKAILGRPEFFVREGVTVDDFEIVEM